MDRRWESLDDATRQTLGEAATLVTFPAGGIIYAQGEHPPPFLYRIETGEALLRLALGEEEIPLATRRQNEWVGWFGAFPETACPFTATAESAVTARAYPHRLIRAAMETNASFAIAVAEAVNDRLTLVHQAVAHDHRVAPVARVETFPFRLRVTEAMSTPAVTMALDATCRDAARRMAQRKITSVVVVDADGIAAGMVTEQDLVRAVFADGEGDHDRRDQPLAEVMSTPIMMISPDAYLYQAMGMMTRRGIRHLPVGIDRPEGVLTMRDIMNLRSRGGLTLIGRIEEEGSVEGLQAALAETAPVVRSLLEEGAPPLSIATFVAHVYGELHARAYRLAVAELGAPPVDCCLFVTGSLGRGECHLLTDQDHGLIIGPDGGEGGEAYAARLGERITDILAQTGIPRCPGDVMSSSPSWRGDLATWKERLRRYVAHPEKEAIRHLTLLADLRPVAGNPALVRDLRRDLLGLLKRNRLALQGLFDEADEHKAPLGLFGRIVTEKGGRLDLKKSGLTFVVEGVRALALLNGIDRVLTADRIGALADGGAINSDDAQIVLAGYETLFRLLLRRQAQAGGKKEPVDTILTVSTLTEKERDDLYEALSGVKRLQGIVRAAFGG